MNGSNHGRSRRAVLRTLGSGLGGTGLCASVAGVAGGQSSASVTFTDQTTDGATVTIDAVETPVEASYTLATDGHEVTFASGEFDAGTGVEEFEVTLDPRLERDRLLEFTLYGPDRSAIAKDDANVSIADDLEVVDGLDVTRIDADPSAGFQYPYFLSAPSVPDSEAEGPILVEPNNTGRATDDYEQHLTAAREIARGEGGGAGRTISTRLGLPFLVPAFPRPESGPVDWRHYVHSLDVQTMEISDGKLARVDRQLLRMVEDARDRLSDTAFEVDDEIALNGFSASGTFVNRFAALHPERVGSVTAGGINGTLILPLSEAKGHTLPYPIGVADVEDLTGDPFDPAAFREVEQFYYLGALDTNDTIGYGDAWDDEQERIALDVYGPNMQRDRLPYCKSVYDERDVSAAFRIYEREGHSPRPAIDDLIEFHRRSIAGESIGGLGGNVGDGGGGEGRPPTAVFEYAPESPAAGDDVQFDATGTEDASGTIRSYTWDFDDGETAAGPRPDHAFSEAGEYDVALSVVDAAGRTSDAERQVSVRSAGGQTGAGFGVATGVAGAAGAGYLAARNGRDE